MDPCLPWRFEGVRSPRAFRLEDLSSLNTEDLLAVARNGDEQAWETVYRRYRPMLAVMVRMRLPNPLRSRLATDDLLQDGFLKAWEKIRTFRYQGEKSFRRWLTTIVLNCLRDLNDHHRAGRRDVHLEVDPSKDDRPGFEPSDEGESGPEQAVQLNEERMRVLEAMTKLSENEQELLCMRLFEDMPWARIGIILSMPETTVRDRYQSSLDRLNLLLAS